MNFHLGIRKDAVSATTTFQFFFAPDYLTIAVPTEYLLSHF